MTEDELADSETDELADSETDELAEDEDVPFLHEELIPALVLVGVVLFIVPEPITSTLGLVLVGLGVGLWVYDLVR